MLVTVFNKQKDLSISKASVKQVLRTLVQKKNIDTDHITVHLLDLDAVCKMHADFFSDPSPTDCMTFPIDPPNTKKRASPPRILGEIVICPQVAISYATENRMDPYQETTLYLIHGFLHLIGYDDITPQMRKQMRYQEKLCFQFLEGIFLQPTKKKIVEKPARSV